jgi:hypothetical protein
MFAVWPACNRDRDLADEPHWCSSVFGCRNACGLADRIDIMEVDDRDFRLVDGAAAIFFICRFNDLTFQRITQR